MLCCKVNQLQYANISRATISASGPHSRSEGCVVVAALGLLVFGCLGHISFCINVQRYAAFCMLVFLPFSHIAIDMNLVTFGAQDL